MKTITIRLNDKLDSELSDIAKSSGVTKSDIVRKALEKHLLVEKFDELRTSLIPFARRAGYYTEEDVYNDSDLS